MRTGRHLATLTGHQGWVRNVVFNPDGQLLAFVSDDQTVTLWDVPRGAVVARLTGHTAAATAITFSPDNDT